MEAEQKQSYLSRRKMETIDRTPVFGPEVEWTYGRCPECERRISLIKSLGVCGFCAYASATGRKSLK